MGFELAEFDNTTEINGMRMYYEIWRQWNWEDIWEGIQFAGGRKSYTTKDYDYIKFWIALLIEELGEILKIKKSSHVYKKEIINIK